MTKEFPGDFENFTKSKEYKNAKKAQKDKYEKDKQHPVKGKHAGFDRLVNAGKKEVEAFKTYRKNRADTQDKARVNARKGGRVNTKRMNQLEELGRVDAEKAYTRKGKRNLKAEKKRIVRSLNSRGAAVRGHGKEIK